MARCFSAVVAVVAAVALVASAAGFASAGSFDANRVHVIDHAQGGRSILFRGSMPREGDSFAYTQLLATMRKVAKSEAGLTLPAKDSDIFITDVSLLSYEVTDWDLEKKYFEAHPAEGEFHLWPIIGQLIPPNDVPSGVRKVMAKDLRDWQVDDLPRTTAFIRALLEDTPPEGKTRVVYVHCEAGEDRTGEVSGSYYVRYLNWSFHRALAYDDHIEKRLIKTESRNAFCWYCYYLKYTTPSRADMDCTIPKNESLAMTF